MPPSERETCQAVLGFVLDGIYPEEALVAAEFPASALAKELELISQAREQVENEISSLSRENQSFDADDWIVQAKKLHDDIEKSRQTAREIVAQHEQTGPLRSQVEDATAKVSLMETEITFNQAVADTLEDVQRLCDQLDDGRQALDAGDMGRAIELLDSTQSAMGEDTFFTNTNVMSIFSLETARFREEVENKLISRWNEQLKVDRSSGTFEVARDIDTGSLGETISFMSQLNVLEHARKNLLKSIGSTIFDSLILPRDDGKVRTLSTTGNGLKVTPGYSEGSVAAVLSQTMKALAFLRENLPSEILSELPESLIPFIVSNLIVKWLGPTIPTTLDGLVEFEKTLEDIHIFAQKVQSWGWQGTEELTSWVNQAPRLWLTRRRVDSLDSVRKALAASKGTTKQVERVEKEQVSRADEVLLESGTDDWDASWDDDKGEDEKEQDALSKPANTIGIEEEEDVSAWGLDDDEDADEESGKPIPDTLGTADDADNDAWGWGDEEVEDQDLNQHGHHLADDPRQSKETCGTIQSAGSREMTLREVYTITDIPESMLEIIRQQVNDSKGIMDHPYSESRVASSGNGLLALPTLILAMFKATASSFYSLRLASGQMYLYNDSLYLASQVRELMDEHDLARLSSDVEALEKFGKLAYSKEMQTQSTIVTDLLDGAQGFAQCSEQPFKAECESAVSAATDRIRDVYAEWKPILSHSALVQSIGSLLSTVISKIVVDVEDLGDISEDQSKQLVALCNQVTQLEDLFTPDAVGDTDPLPVTAVYVANWLRFQYLINILESSLADIKYLWLEGELGLEFSTEEVVDLIEALFAESEHRRRAIAEIKRAPRGLGN
ncbi:hypothetical protein N7539_005046 [Penicillium diatomitis]|uniref:ZW10 C-terminal helical domain-containing protein n=1 Tax=Penicillium diatomitis TaxID=2819901 RepID=A0A9W9X5Y4_9EURO|nr:uncharacterized protein N7539_005046 [Penicillium diatomitis]KAJ5485058.1 hypothetical protein N7539_005046 [Penicillium diatomitis]